MHLVAIAIGGALGAVLRYLSIAAINAVSGPTFPLGTLTVNVLGSFLMGLLVVCFQFTDWIPANMKLLLTVGFLGSFTTFSTFSMDTMRLFEAGQIGQALGYMVASLVLTVAACSLGLLVARGLFS